MMKQTSIISSKFEIQSSAVEEQDELFFTVSEFQEVGGRNELRSLLSQTKLKACSKN